MVDRGVGQRVGHRVGQTGAQREDTEGTGETGWDRWACPAEPSRLPRPWPDQLDLKV